MPGLLGPALRDYQLESVAAAAQTLTAGGGRVTVALPCGAGKTLVGQHIAERIGARTVLLFAPTVHLVEQNLRSWIQVRPGLRTIAVHGTQSGDDSEEDEDTADIGGLSAADLVSTDADTITTALATPAGGDLLVACTYHSAARITELGAHPAFDLVVLDEAHRTVGELGRPWQTALDRQAIPATWQLALTATPKTVTVPEPRDSEVSEPPITVIDMADTDTYGPVIAPLTVRQAIAAGHLADYRIVIVAVTDTEAAKVLDQQPGAGVQVADQPDPLDPRWVPGQVALLDVMRRHGARTALTFTNTVEASRTWASTLTSLSALVPAAAMPAGEGTVRHVDGHTPAADRHAALAAIAAAGSDRWAVISNCRLLGEGVDAPALDVVMYAEARTSTVDIVQCTGRALRRNPLASTKKATIVLPVTIPVEHTARADRRVAASAFRHVAQVLAALATTDQMLADVLLQMRGDPPDTPPPTDPAGFMQVIGVDDPQVAHWWGRAFRSHVVNRITRIEAELLPAAAAYARRVGHTRIPVGFTDRWGRPIGRQIADLRGRHRDGLIDHGVATQFEQIDHWTWTLPGATQEARRREIIGHITALVHGPTDLPVARYAHRQMADGSTLRLGEWIGQQANRYRQLPEPARTELDRLLGGGWQYTTASWIR